MNLIFSAVRKNLNLSGGVAMYKLNNLGGSAMRVVELNKREASVIA